jgi:transcriptional regulator with XRE-family HTH domain
MVSSKDVKDLRKILNLKQRELAEKLGVSVGTIQNYEAGGVIPINKQLMIEGMLSNAHNLNISGDGNITNTGIVGGGISTIDDGDFANKIIELEKKVLKLQGELATRDETIKGLKNELTVRVEMINLLQNKQK